jgi:DNA-binding transcriptional LysR family regulator
MRVEQLRYFVRVLEARSFRQAADELHISQPALSESIKNLERDLGARLMERNRSGVRLTQIGQEAIPYIEAILEADDALRNEVGSHRGLERGLVRIGTVNAATNNVLPAVLTSFHARYPSVQLQVTETGSLNIRRSVKAGDFDLGLVVDSEGMPGNTESLISEVLLESSIMACVPRGHHLLQRCAVTPLDITEEPLILFRAGYFMSDLVQRILHGSELNVVYYTDNTESAKRMIAAGVGITLLPRFSVVPDLLSKSGEITYIPLVGDYVTLRLNLIRRRDAYAARAVRELWESFREQALSVSSQPPDGRAARL